MNAPLPPLFLALSPGVLQGDAATSWIARATAARRAGLRGLLLREPGLDDRRLLALARELARLFTPPEGWLGVHDRGHVALACGAQAVHLGFRSLTPAAARLAVGDGLALGLSTHGGDGERAWAGADYLFHGPVHATASKAGWVAPIGFEGLALGVARAGVPVWALGGLRPEDVPRALDAGCRGVAVRGGVFGGDDPAGAVRAYLAAFDAR